MISTHESIVIPSSDLYIFHFSLSWLLRLANTKDNFMKRNFFKFGKDNYLEYDLRTRALIDLFNVMINDVTIKGTGFDVAITPSGIKLSGNTTEEESNIDIRLDLAGNYIEYDAYDD